MGLIGWIKGLFAPTPSRDVATVAAIGSAEQQLESVSRAPEPLRPHHRRMTVRDPRLLPKPARRDRFGLAGKRQRVMGGAEANRLFARSLRTRDRRLRDLASDPEQLERYGLPRWDTEAEMAAALGITVGQLQHFSIHRDRERCPHYVAFAVRKRSGGQRIIHAPKTRLKAIQRQLVELLVGRLPVHDAAHGFVRGRSVRSNAAPHVGKAIVLKFDLVDCFGSIHFGRIRGLLIALGYGYPVATALAVLMSEAPRQPVQIEDELFHVPVGPRVCVQGAPTSPGLCNAVLMRLDRRLTGLASKFGYDYTRYADDLTFSGDDPTTIRRLLRLVPAIVREEGFVVNRKKTRVQRRARCQRVTGVVVNDVAGLSRRERRRLRAAVHQFVRDGGDARARQRLAGQIAYLAMLNPEQAEPLQEALRGAK